jgi:ribosomal protein L11 methyltransferase
MTTPAEHDNFADLPLWEYATPGPLRERLCGLTLAGVKTATFDVVTENEEPPPIGSQWVMIGSDNARLAVLEVVKLTEMRIAEVPWALANAEGESFTDVAHWRRGHDQFWNTIGLIIEDDTMVRCEQFRLVEVLPAATAARYPVVEVIAPVADADWVSSELAELDTIGIEEVASAYSTDGREVPSDHLLFRAGFASDVAAAHAELELSRNWWRRFEVLIGNEWLDAWRDDFTPVEVGRLLVWPSWKGDAPAVAHPDQLVIPFDPGRAWGTGGHESTKLALTMLQALPELVGATVFDAGCGSGILSVAAVLLGADHADGVDTDMASPQIMMENAERSLVQDRVSASAESIEHVAFTRPGSYGLIVANILAPVLIEIAPALLTLRQPGAPIVLAGLIDTQVERVLRAYAPLQKSAELRDGVWRGLVLRE